MLFSEWKKLMQEKMLASEFKFGFEFEYIVNNEYEKRVQREIIKYWGKEGSRFVNDTSIKPDSEDEIGKEYNSPVLTMNPKNLKKFIDFFKVDLPWKINDSCGFHIHFSTEKMTYQDILWFCVQFALLDNKEQNILNKLESEDVKIDFLNEEFAGIDNFRIFRDSFKTIKNKNSAIKWVNKFIKTISEYRYLIINPHSVYKTIEWRSPRKFIDNPKNVEIFIKKLYDFINMYSNLITKKYLENDYIKIYRNEINDTMYNKRGVELKNNLEKVLYMLKRKYNIFWIKPELFDKMYRNTVGQFNIYMKLLLENKVSLKDFEKFLSAYFNSKHFIKTFDVDFNYYDNYDDINYIYEVEKNDREYKILFFRYLADFINDNFGEEHKDEIREFLAPHFKRYLGDENAI